MKWTEKELKILKDAYPLGGRTLVYKVLQAEGFNRSLKAIGAKAKVQEIRSYSKGRFRPGEIPHNKGCNIDAATMEKIKGTWFQTGHLPHNTKKDYCISLRKDNRGVAYKFIRIALGKWVHLHRYLWEKEYGEIPKGKLITFIDGNPMNCKIENLEMIDRAEHLRRRWQAAGGMPYELMSDNYVTSVLKRNGIHPDAITNEMIEVKRLQLILIKKLKKDERSS